MVYQGVGETRTEDTGGHSEQLPLQILLYPEKNVLNIIKTKIFTPNLKTWLQAWVKLKQPYF